MNTDRIHNSKDGC